MQQRDHDKERRLHAWLRDEAGRCIDGIEEILHVFTPKDLDSVVLLRGQIRHVQDRAAQLELPAVVTAARQALGASPLEMQASATALVALLRKIARVVRRRPAQGTVCDADTGLMTAEGFARRLAAYENAGEVHAAVGEIVIEDGPEVAAAHGGQVAIGLVCHLAMLLTDQLREYDVVARKGAYEFAVFLPAEDLGGWQSAISRIEAALTRAPFQLPGGGSLPVRIRHSGYQLGIDDRSVPAREPLNMSQTIVGSLSAIEADAAKGPAQRIGVAMQNETTASVVGSLLERAGHEVVPAGPDPARRFAHFATSKLHLVISDDVHNNLSAIRQALGRRRTPVLAIVDSEHGGAWALDHGAREYLLKPVRMEVLLSAVKRRVRRVLKDADAPTAPGGVLVVSDRTGQLIGLGSAIQKQGGFRVHLGRGPDDAIAQVQQHGPAVVVVDMMSRNGELRKLTDFIARADPRPALVIIVDPEERAAMSHAMRNLPATIMTRPVVLKTLHTDVQAAAGRPLAASEAESRELLRTETLRITRMAMGLSAAPGV